jgi:hypothetical protein
MAAEPIQGLRYPAGGDEPDGPAAVKNLADDVVKLTNMQFASEAAADATLVGSSAPVDGMERFTGSGPTGVKWLRHNGKWRRLYDDTGWVPVPIRAGFARQGSIDPAVRRIGNTVYWSWGFSNAGMSASTTHSVADIPVGFRPNSTRSEYYGAISSNSAAAQGSIIIYQSGLVIVRTPATLGSYYIATFSYTLDPE